MRLYHYTAISKLDSILAVGLTRGEVVINFDHVLNGVNLTTDPSSSGHGLGSGSFFTPQIATRLGLHLRQNDIVPFFPNKRKVRISVDIERSSVTRWLRWSLKNVDAVTREQLIRSGGGMPKARSWYLSFDPIYPDNFEAVEISQDGEWIDHREYAGPMGEELPDHALVTGYRHWGDQLRIGRTQSFLNQLDKALADAAANAA
jgi:hypothetical protein